MIKIENLNYKISGYQILSDINLELTENEIIVLVGANGCGKSTFIKCFASLLDYDGKITVDHIELKKTKNKVRSKLISYLPQNCIRTNIKVNTLVKHGRFPYMNFGEKLSLEDMNCVEEAITFTGIQSLVEKNVMDISGGERQLSYLAMILAQNTPIILLDEPNTFLDIEHQIFLFQLVKHLKEKGKTIILVLHDLIQAMEIADKIIVMEHGKILDYGKPLQVKNSIEKTFRVKISRIDEMQEGVESLYQYCLIKNKNT